MQCTHMQENSVISNSEERLEFGAYAITILVGAGGRKAQENK